MTENDVPFVPSLREGNREKNNVVDVCSAKGNGSGYQRGDEPIHSPKLVAVKMYHDPFLPKFPYEAIAYYNLACYECQSNRIASAKQYLKQAFRIDPNWRLQALDDEDLKPLWDSI